MRPRLRLPGELSSGDGGLKTAANTQRREHLPWTCRGGSINTSTRHSDSWLPPTQHSDSILVVTRG
jgi:hypothetical protein